MLASIFLHCLKNSFKYHDISKIKYSIYMIGIKIKYSNIREINS